MLAPLTHLYPHQTGWCWAVSKVVRLSELVINTRCPLYWQHLWCDVELEQEAGQLLIAGPVLG